MLLSCKCLNVLLDVVEPSEARPLDAHDPRLKDDVFFEQDVRQVLRVSRVTQTLPTFVRRRTCDEWSFEECLNCRTQTHATLTLAAGASFVLVNAALISSPQIEALRQHQSYSQVYKVLVFDAAETHRRRDRVAPDVERSLQALKEKVDECVRVERMQMEGRVRAYAERQTRTLEAFERKARDDYEHLVHALLRCATKLETPETKQQSPDAECLFDIEGMDADDDDDKVVGADVEDADATDEEDGAQRRRAPPGDACAQMAKSLPMNIPVYLRPRLDDTLEEDGTRAEHSKDIAASMRALARSVNGDAVFGELPRPRCSAHIV